MIRFWKILLIYFVLFLIAGLRQYQWIFSIKERFPTTLIHSGLIINSFNPSIIHLSLSSHISQSNILSILDNNRILFQVSNLSTITMILSDGYHHLDLVISDQIKKIEYYQGIDISIGSQSLIVTVLTKQYRPVENITVHLELVEYPNIDLDYQTNQFGEVIFSNLPKHTEVYIETICMHTKRHAYVEIDTSNYRNITLILTEMSLLYDEEYDGSDRGYYAV